MRAAIKVIFAVIMRHVVLKLISILCSRHRCRKIFVWQQCDNTTTCDNESSAGWLMKSDAMFTQDSLLSWLMCLLSPLIIIPIEVTPETAGTWGHISPCHTPVSSVQLVTMGKLSQHTNTDMIVSWESGLLWNFTGQKHRQMMIIH